MTQNQNVIGLISGGKDSFFSLLHCQANGHRIVALANLYPPPSPPNKPHTEEDDSDDLNSFMYQTVGHTLIPLYAEILSLPLYRQGIRGSALNQAKEYSTYHGHDGGATAFSSSKSTGLDVDVNIDETESMMTLLQRIKADHPETNAVCSGAILSSYQRTRIESVARRLDLVPLAYLWQYPLLPTPVPREAGLLEDMAAIGLDARIVKVASGGLDESLLWENVCAEATRKRIVKAVGRFGGSVLGEGGEFETLVVDGPGEFFKGAIEVGVEQRMVVRGGGGEASLRFMGGSVLQREKRRDDDTAYLGKLRKPKLLDGAFEELLETVNQEGERTPALTPRVSRERQSSGRWEWGDSYHICTGTWTTHVSNLSASHIQGSTQAQMEEINRSLLSLLEHRGHRSSADIIFTTILLRSADDFQAVNQKYAELFGSRPNPPARVTVSCGNMLPPGVNVMMSVVIAHGPDVGRQHLHVQSVSYWAPANIGPYSQATSIRLGDDDDDDAPAVVYVAGQIPLVPSSMEMVTRVGPEGGSEGEHDAATTFRLQTTLALQHLWRIGQAMDVSWWIGAIAFVVAGEDDVRDKASVAALAWEKIHARARDNRLTRESTPTDDTGFDVWNERCRNGLGFMPSLESKVLPDFSCLSFVPDDEIETSSGYPVASPFFTVEVAQLPRNSPIEWQGLGASRCAVKFFATIWEDDNSVTACSLASGKKNFGFIGIRLLLAEDVMYKIIDSTISMLPERRKGPRAANEHRTIYTSYKMDITKMEAQIVPCRSVWSVRGEELSAALVVEYEREVK
ncbi:MAG: hypothetical protein Q9168_001265 [Polycauliona sp. 1 TL-2023]